MSEAKKILLAEIFAFLLARRKERLKTTGGADVSQK